MGKILTEVFRLLHVTIHFPQDVLIQYPPPPRPYCLEILSVYLGGFLSDFLLCWNFIFLDMNGLVLHLCSQSMQLPSLHDVK